MTTSLNPDQNSNRFIPVFKHSFRSVGRGFKDDRWRRQKDEIQHLSESSVLVSLIWWFLSLSSLPLGYLHELLKVWFACIFTFRGQLKSIDGWQIRHRFDETEQRRLKYTETWALLWLAISIALLFQGSSVWWYLVPLLRLFDFLYIEWCRFVRSAPVRFPVRWVSLLVVHYLEVVVISASFYLFLQAQHMDPVFLVNNSPALLDPFQALHFSVMNAVTIGSSVTPVLLKGLPYLCSPAFWSWFEFLFVIFITVVEIPRLLNTSAQRDNTKEKDPV